jgi:hypothetical protein
MQMRCRGGGNAEFSAKAQEDASYVLLELLYQQLLMIVVEL